MPLGLDSKVLPSDTAKGAFYPLLPLLPHYYPLFRTGDGSVGVLDVVVVAELAHGEYLVRRFAQCVATLTYVFGGRLGRQAEEVHDLLALQFVIWHDSF